MQVLVGLLAFFAAILVGTFVEYWGHRLMHNWRWGHHARHHQHNQGQGWLGEFRDYALPSSTIAWVGFLHSTAAGMGFALGALAYAALAAYAHQLQHERPGQVFWMAQPTHAVHHYHSEWHHNFGITVDLWDRVFGTYRWHEPEEALLRHGGTRAFWQIHWATPAPSLPRRKRRAEPA
ncbi:MAG: sterol desaturase family protein [Myxococcota bacterium]